MSINTIDVIKARKSIMKKILVLLIAAVIALQFTGCNRKNEETTSVESENTATAATSNNEQPVKTQQSSQTAEKEPEPTETPPVQYIIDNSIESADGKEVIVHNTVELLLHLQSNKHLKLMPGYNYDLHNPENEIMSKNYKKGKLTGLSNVTIEGIGDQQVDFITSSVQTVLELYNCTDINLINLNIGHVETNDDCLGDVVGIYNNCNNITVKNCTIYGCGRIGIRADNATGIKFEDSVIRDCTERLMDLNNVSNAEFINCLFHTETDQNIVIENCSNIRINNSIFSGDYSNYPKINVDGSNILEHPTDAPVHQIADKSVTGVSLENNQIIGLEFMAELNGLFSGVRATVSANRDYFFGDFYLSVTLEYPEIPDQSEYFSHYNAVCSICNKYDGLKSIKLYCTGNKVFFSDSIFYDYISCYAENPDVGKILNDEKSYLTVDQASKILKDWFPSPKSINDQEAKLTDEVTISHGDVYLANDTAYYGLDIHADKTIYSFRVNAADGTITQDFDGVDFVPVDTATQEQIDAVLDYLESIGSNLLEEPYRAYFVNGIIKLNHRPYILRNQNGILVAEPYDEWTGY